MNKDFLKDSNNVVYTPVFLLIKRTIYINPASLSIEN